MTTHPPTPADARAACVGAGSAARSVPEIHAVSPQLAAASVDRFAGLSAVRETIVAKGPTNASAPRHMALERRLRASPTVKDTTDVNNMVPPTPDTNQQQAEQPVHYLTADDPRHGTYAGARAHWRQGGPLCGACKLAANRRRQTNRLRALEGRPSLIENLGTIRRIHALQALGYGFPQLARESGIPQGTLQNIVYSHSLIRRDTAETFALAYERLCMTVAQGRFANRGRAIAARRGWAPPLAWDDIDDKDETPSDWQYDGGDRHADLDDLLEQGAWLSEACRVLDLSAVALEKWCDRNGRRSDFHQLVARERGAA